MYSLSVACYPAKKGGAHKCSDPCSISRGFDWFALICILMSAVIGGYFPLIRRDLVKGEGFPLGQAFSAGVFLALSLIIMLPNGSHLFKKALPHVGYPLASVAALVAYLTLLALGHAGNAERSAAVREDLLTTPLIPVIMTVMIAIPSFLLGTALGISDTSAALVIFVAIMLHKGSAGFDSGTRHGTEHNDSDAVVCPVRPVRVLHSVGNHSGRRCARVSHRSCHDSGKSDDTLVSLGGVLLYRERFTR